MARIVITGSTGMLGKYVKQKALSMGHEIICPTRAEMDLLNPAGITEFLLQVKPDAILHLAAETNVDLCEREPFKAGIANQKAVRSVAIAARECKAWLLSISTSNVFGQENRPLSNELDVPAPLNYYGKSKLQGEKEIEKFYPENSFIIRAGWMIGGGRQHDHKFVGKMLEQIANGAETLRAVCDKYGTITSAKKLAEYIVGSLTERRQGLVHYASSGVISRYGITQEIARLTNFRGNIEPVMSVEFPLSAPRPVFEGITSIYIDKNDPTAPHNWAEDLKEYLKEFD